jgi:uncharacterized protein YjdB
MAPPFAASIELMPTSASVAVGHTQQFTATADDATGTQLTTEPTFLWSSNNTAVATVDDTGLATAKGAGTALITANACTGSTCTASTTNGVHGSATLTVQ